MTDDTPTPAETPAGSPPSGQPDPAAATPAAVDAAATQPIPPPVGGPTEPMPPVVPEQPFGHPQGVPMPVYAAAPPPPRRGVRRLWHDVTATTGGRVATVIAAAFVVLVLFGALGLGAAAIGRLGDERQSATAPLANGGRPGFGGNGGRPGFQGNGGQQGFGNGTTPYGQRGQGGQLPNGPSGPGGRFGDGLGGAGGPDGLGALGALGGVLHGEFVTRVGGTTTTMVVQVGQVTAYTKGSSLSVKSSDGFATTYKVDGNSRLVASRASAISVGDQVRVLATKSGPTVTTVQIISTTTGSSPSSGNGA